MTRKSQVKIGWVLAFTSFTLMNSVSASASTSVAGSYHAANTHKATTSDLTGTGTVFATASADKLLGSVSAETRATSNLAAGQLIDTFGYAPTQGAGGTNAFSYGEVNHVFANLPSRPHSVEVHFTSLTSTYSFSSGGGLGTIGYSTSRAFAVAQADAVVEYYVCIPGTIGCSPSHVDRVVHQLPPTATGSTLTLGTDFSGPSTFIVVRTGVVSRAQAWGAAGSASSKVSAVIGAITVN